MKEILIRVAANGALIAGLGGLATAMVVFIANFDDSISESLPKFFAKLTMVSLAVFIVSLFLLTVFR